MGTANLVQLPATFDQATVPTTVWLLDYQTQNQIGQEQIVINWRCRPEDPRVDRDGASTQGQEMDATPLQFYVVRGPVAQDVPAPLEPNGTHFESTVALSCEWGSEAVDHDDAGEVFQSIWAHIAAGVTEGHGIKSLSCTGDETLRYYAASDWHFSGTLLRYLLGSDVIYSDHDGRCGSWSNWFMELCNSQSIPRVERWKFKPKPGTKYMVVKSSLNGQGPTIPPNRTLHPDHQLCRGPDGRWYDPSYGTVTSVGGDDGIAEWEDSALERFEKADGTVEPNEADTKEVETEKVP